MAYMRFNSTRRGFRFLLSSCAVVSLCIALMAFCVRPSDAHPMPQSAVLMDMHQNGVSVEMHMPLSELEVGFGHPLLSGDPASNIAQNRSLLAAYIAQHMTAVAPDGRAWTTQVRDIELGPDELPQYYIIPVKYLEAHAWLAPPPGEPVRHFTLHYDVIMNELITHKALISINQDWNSGILSGEPDVLGTAKWNRQTFEVNLTPGSPWRGFFSVVHLGMRHIAEGTDHLLFLLALLIPAPLFAAAGRWAGPTTAKNGAWRLLKIVTGFTIGHSITLIIGSLGWFHWPEQPIEVLIAFSILVSAIHAIRPLFPGREAYIAAGFGLIHGMSFAVVLSGFHLDALHMAMSIFGFNIGIEAMQLIVVGVTVPWLILLARTPAYTPFRLIAASCAGIAAIAWMAERALSWNNPIDVWVEAAAAHAIWIVAGIAALAVIANIVMHLRQPHEARFRFSTREQTQVEPELAAAK